MGGRLTSGPAIQRSDLAAEILELAAFSPFPVSSSKLPVSRSGYLFPVAAIKKFPVPMRREFRVSAARKRVLIRHQIGAEIPPRKNPPPHPPPPQKKKKNPPRKTAKTQKKNTIPIRRNSLFISLLAGNRVSSETSSPKTGTPPLRSLSPLATLAIGNRYTGRSEFS